MPNYYVDSNTGDNGDNGTTQALAWEKIEYALESGGLAAGDIVWVRRTHSEIPVSNIEPAYDGTAAAPITITCYPRPSRAITQADWTAGSATVDNIVGLTMALADHGARYITAPDGRKYLITRVVDANTIMVLNEYAGTTVTGVNGACSIDADPLYASRPADVDGWDADDDTLPLIDFNETVYFLNLSSDDYHYFNGIQIGDSGNVSYGNMNIDSSGVLFSNCIIYQTINKYLWRNGPIRLLNSIVYGNNAGTSQRIHYMYGTFENSAIYGLGDASIIFGSLNMINCNFDIEIAGTKGITTNRNSMVMVINSQLDNIVMAYNSNITEENYSRTINAHRAVNLIGMITKVDVVAGSGDPEKRTSGSDSVVEICYNKNTTDKQPVSALTPTVFSRVIVADGTQRTFRFYVQSIPALTTEVWFDVSYIDLAGHPCTTTAVDAIDARSGATDWDDYIDVTVPAALSGSNIHIDCKCNYYSADSGNKIYVDPGCDEV